MLAQPGRQRPKLIGCLVFIDFLVAARRCSGLLASASIEAERTVERLVAVLELEKDLVRLLLVLEVGRVKRLQKIEIEIARRLCGGPLVGSSEERVAATPGAPFPPLDLMLPDS